MDCPACGGTLHEVKVGEVTVDVCVVSCAGIWFDRRELEKVDEAFEPDDAALTHLTPVPGVTVDHERRRSCPRCDDVVLGRRFNSLLRDVTLDECPGCAGVWLDAAELAKIRAQHREPGDRDSLEAAAAMGARVAEFEARTHGEVEGHGVLTRLFRGLRWGRYTGS
jgi:hypothetical protein